MSDFTNETECVLRMAGWMPGRQVDTAEWRRGVENCGFQWGDAADRFLAEFGGLTVEFDGPGITVAREPFDLDPMLAYGEADRFGEWADVVGESITPLGELDSGRYLLGISESGVLYLVADWLALCGRVPEAIESLILGKKPVPVDQNAASLPLPKLSNG